MGGKIFVQSEKGVGSEFSFSIPYRPAGSTKAKVAILNNEHLIKNMTGVQKNVFLSTIIKDVLIYLNRILTDTGVSIVTARSGFEAIEIIKRKPGY